MKLQLWCIMLRNWSYGTGCGRSRNLTAAWRQWGVSQVTIEVKRQGGRGRCLSQNRNDMLYRETSHPQSVWTLLASSLCGLLSVPPVHSQNDELFVTARAQNLVFIMLLVHRLRYTRNMSCSLISDTVILPWCLDLTVMTQLSCSFLGPFQESLG
jgi:hypothetical protein